MPIVDIFKKNIQREINGVIKAGVKDKELIQNEIEEYVITKEIARNMQKLFSNYADSFNSNTENVGVWISGFFGSGKSHLLKMLGNIIDNGNYNGKNVVDYFEEKLDGDKILFGNVKKASDYKTDVILFDIGKVSDQDGISSHQSIAVALQRKFNEFMGFFKDDLKLAEFERFLWRENRYEDFKNVYQEETGFDWVIDRKNFNFRQVLFLDVISKLDLKGFDDEAAERWLEQENLISISPESFTELLKEYLDRVGDNRRIVFLIDEVGQFIGESSPLILNLQAIVEQIGQELRGKVWLMVTSQQGIKEIVDQKTIKFQDFSKIQDRFKTRLPLSSSNVDEVIKKRLLEKTDESKAGLKSFYESNRINIGNLITFERNDFKLNLYDDAKDFVDTYPFVPYQFFLLQKVFEKIRKMSHSGQHQSKGERSLLNAFHEASNKLADKDLGTIVPFYDFYDSIEQFLDDTVRKPIIQAKEVYRMEDFDIHILKLLFLLKGLEEIITNIDNLASFCISNIEKDDRTSIKEKIEKSLKRLEKQHLIQRNGEKYFFLTDDEQDINREIKDVKIDNYNLLKVINDVVFEEILNTNKLKVKTTGNLYSFSKKIDGQFFSNQSSKLVCHLISPYIDKEYQEDASFKMYTQRESSSLFIKMEDVDNYMEEIREYLQIDQYISDKMSTNPVDNILRVLQIKQGEKRDRKVRIKDYISKSLEMAKFYLNGTEIRVGSKSARETLLEGLSAYAETLYRNASLIKSPYDEKKIKSILAYDYSLKLTGNNNELKNNINFEAIKELESFMNDLNDRHDIINMKKIVDRFTDVPYGWNLLDIQGLITEIFVLSRVIIKYNGEEIELNDSKYFDIITRVKGSNQEKVLIRPKGERPIDLIRKATSIMKKIFSVSFNVDENSFEKETIKFFNTRKNLARIELKHYDTNKKYEYPGKGDIEEYIDFLEEVIESSKTEKDLCENIIKESDELEELKYKAETVFNFFDSTKTKKSLFDSGIKKLEELDFNEHNYGELKNCSDAKAIISILTNKTPYHNLHEITEHMTQIDKEIKIMIENEKKNILKELRFKEDTALNQFNEKNDSEIINLIKEKYGDLKNTLEITKGEKIFQLNRQVNIIESKILTAYKDSAISLIRSYEKEVLEILKNKENVDKVIKEIRDVFLKFIRETEGSNNILGIKRASELAEEEKENWINVANGKEKKKERVSFKLKRSEKRGLEKKSEVEEYINEMEKELKGLKDQLIKAVEENKRVDVY